VGLNLWDLSKAIETIKSTLLSEGNQSNNRQYRVNFRNTQCLIIKLFQTMNEDKQIRGIESNVVPTRIGEFRNGFLLRLAKVDPLTSLCVWLEAYSSHFDENFNHIASDDVTNLFIRFTKPHGTYFLIKVLVAVAAKFPHLEKLEIFWEYGRNQPNSNTGGHLLHEDLKTYQIKGKCSTNLVSFN